jgi:ribosome-binding protein aMBF1 (putative translation factor)
MSKEASIKKFLKTVKDDTGNWLEEARYRRDNRDWLRKSQLIAIRLLLTLKERGMQQKELAEQLGVSPQQVSKIVKGKENLTLETISRLESVLGISLFEVPKTQVELENPGH